MNFGFSEEQEQLREQVRRFFAERCPPLSVRKILEGEDAYDRSVYRGMAEMGLLGAAIPENYGGSGLGPLELCVIAEEAGRALAPVPLMSSIYLVAEMLMYAGTPAQKEQWLPRLASADIVGTFAHAEAMGRVTPETIRSTVRNGKLSGVKRPVPDGIVAGIAIVSAYEGGRLSLWLVDLNGPGVRRESLSSLDPTRGQATLSFEDASAEPLPGSDWAGTEAALDRAAVLVAFEQIGGADRSLEQACDFARERMAFGRPIGSFQAIKHMLADMYVAVTLARSNSCYGAWALSAEAPELPIAAATARVSATQAFLKCSKNSIQVHGGMGFTWESDCHLHYRRANALAVALGSQSAWEDRLITHLKRRNMMPAATEGSRDGL